MQIIAWRDFSKKRNSTKRPATRGIEIDVFLKEETSIEYPSFVLAEPLAEYTYIRAFGHYYFVTDVINLDAYHSEIRCSQDVLATYKNEIMGMSAKVLYSSSNYSLDIPDDRMATLLTHTNSERTVATFSFLNTTGCYVLGVVNGQSNGVGGIATYYALNKTELTNLSNKLNNLNLWEQLVQQFTNPMDAIISCAWLPIDISSIPGYSASIYLGTYDTEVSGKQISNRELSVVKTCQIPWHTNVKNYMKSSKFTTATMMLPFVGVVPFDNDLFYNHTQFELFAFFDLISGDVLYTLGLGADSEIVYHGNCATSIPLSASGYNASGAVTGVVTAIGGVVAGIISGGTSGAVTAAGAAVGGAVTTEKSLEIHTQINGSASSAIGVHMGDAVIIYMYTKNLADDMTAYAPTNGLPCYQYLRLGTLTGYCQCENASISLNGRSGDRDAINSFLNSGIFIE